MKLAYVICYMLVVTFSLVSTTAWAITDPTPGAPVQQPSGGTDSGGSGSGSAGPIFGNTSGGSVSGRNSGTFGNLQDVGIEIRRIIEFILIPIIIALALLAFLWGVFTFIRNADDEGKRAEGRQFMLWGIIGLAVMMSVWGLVQILTNTIGEPLEIPTLERISR
jgi:hypothetical protein